MAVKKDQFTENVMTNLKANKTYTKFFINFTKAGKRINRVIDYSEKDWNKRTRISNATMQLQELKTKEKNSGINFNENSTLNQLKDVYFEKSRQSTNWTDELKSMYRLHIQNQIGHKKIKDIRKIHIDDLRLQMEKQGHSKQTANGCSPRTIKKVLIQSLKPILQYAVDNKVLNELPIIEVPKQKSRKKTVKDAGEKFKLLFLVIMELYKDDPFYRSLFLFAWHGRRWNEIRTLNWDDIDWNKNLYTIKAENNKIGEEQTYQLLPMMKQALESILDDKAGLVFKSPITGKELYTPKKQLAKIKEKSNIPELTMHFFRHIAVSAFGEIGISNTILSAALGHTNLQTVNDYYLTANHTKSSQELNKAIEQLLLVNKE